MVGSFESPAYEREVRQFAASLNIADRVDWRGFQSDVDGELAQMDLLAFPSLLAEGMPMVPLEAMAAGVPLVASRVDGVSDLVRDGIDGLLCRPGDAADLADAVARAIRCEVNWQSLRASAHRRQQDEYSDRAMAAGVARVYRDVLSACFEPKQLSKGPKNR